MATDRKTEFKSSVRDATEEWGCATHGCLEPARFIVTSKTTGSEWGACKKHLKAVRRDVEN